MLQKFIQDQVDREKIAKERKNLNIDSEELRMQETKDMINPGKVFKQEP